MEFDDGLIVHLWSDVRGRVTKVSADFLPQPYSQVGRDFYHLPRYVYLPSVLLVVHAKHNRADAKFQQSWKDMRLRDSLLAGRAIASLWKITTDIYELSSSCTGRQFQPVSEKSRAQQVALGIQSNHVFGASFVQTTGHA